MYLIIIVVSEYTKNYLYSFIIYIFIISFVLYFSYTSKLPLQLFLYSTQRTFTCISFGNDKLVQFNLTDYVFNSLFLLKQYFFLNLHPGMYLLISERDKHRSVASLSGYHALSGYQTHNLGMCLDQLLNLQLFWCMGQCSN